MASISESVRLKSKMSAFSVIRSALTDLGMTATPRCRCQRKMNCAAVLRWFSANSMITG